MPSDNEGILRTGFTTKVEGDITIVAVPSDYGWDVIGMDSLGNHATYPAEDMSNTANLVITALEAHHGEH